MSPLLINVGGLALIALIVWWFWFSKPRAARAAGPGPIEITVADGVYTPARIEVAAGRPVTLRFLRTDPSPCAEKVLFDELALSAELPIGRPMDVVLGPLRPGEHTFTCEMRMYRGTLVAR